jgi:hypothetical protein
MARKPKTRAPYTMVSPATWELARADYLGGMTAAAVAKKHAIGLHNLRQTMARKGWTKRALAEARAVAGPGGPAVTAPTVAAETDFAAAGGDLLEAVMARARAALTGGRGGEASALLKATREYVLVRQDIEDARALHRDQRAEWDRIAPERAGPLDEQATVQTLHARWSRLSDLELAHRADPTDQTGMVDWLRTMAQPPPASKRR